MEVELLHELAKDIAGEFVCAEVHIVPEHEGFEGVTELPEL
jgi:hypothetical protein